jgi:hypothetical protein
MAPQTGHSFIRLLRLTALVAFILIVLVVGAGNTAWTTSVQGQTVPPGTETPAPPPPDDGDDDDDDDDDDPTPTALPTSTTAPASPTPEAATPEPTPEPTPDDVVSIPVGPGTGGSVEIPPWEIIVSPDDFDQPVTIEVVILPEDERFPPNPGERHLGPVVCTVALDEDGNPIPASEFRGPVEVCYDLSPEELALLDGDPSRAIIQVYDIERGIWIDLPTTVSPDGTRVCALVSYTGCFAVRIGEAQELPVVLPETGIEEEIPLPAMLPDTSAPAGSASTVTPARAGFPAVGSVLTLLLASGGLLFAWQWWRSRRASA